MTPAWLEAMRRGPQSGDLLDRHRQYQALLALVETLAGALVRAEVCLALMEKGVKPPHPDDWPFAEISKALARYAAGPQ